jgi:hypothetical protein
MSIPGDSDSLCVKIIGNVKRCAHASSIASLHHDAMMQRCPTRQPRGSAMTGPEAAVLTCRSAGWQITDLVGAPTAGGQFVN